MAKIRRETTSIRLDPALNDKAKELNLQKSAILEKALKDAIRKQGKEELLGYLQPDFQRVKKILKKYGLAGHTELNEDLAKMLHEAA